MNTSSVQTNVCSGDFRGRVSIWIKANESISLEVELWAKNRLGY